MDIAHYKERLTEEKATLEAELATVGQQTAHGDWEAKATETEHEADANDEASNLGTFRDNAAILNDLDARLHDVLAALARIEDGTYGTCSVSGEAIEEERLEADPAAATCKAHLNS